MTDGRGRDATCITMARICRDTHGLVLFLASKELPPHVTNEASLPFPSFLALAVVVAIGQIIVAAIVGHVDWGKHSFWCWTGCRRWLKKEAEAPGAAAEACWFHGITVSR